MKLFIVIAVSILLIGLAAWFEFRTLSPSKHIESENDSETTTE